MRPWIVVLSIAAAAIAACDSPTKLTESSASPIGNIRSARIRRLLDTIAFTTGGVIGTYTNVPNATTDEPNMWAVQLSNVGLAAPPYAEISVYVVGTVTPSVNAAFDCCFTISGVDSSLAGTPIGPAGALDASSHYEFVANASSPGFGLLQGTISGDSSSFGPYGLGSSPVTFGFYRTGTWAGDVSCFYNDPGYCFCPTSCPVENVNTYSLVGSETETIYRYADQILLAASTQSGTGPTSITFTASTNDGGSIFVDPWTWTPDSGTDSTQACSLNQQNPCTTTVYSSGIMSTTVYDYNAGRTEQTGLHIVITP
jgi:hypothetical protein